MYLAAGRGPTLHKLRCSPRVVTTQRLVGHLGRRVGHPHGIKSFRTVRGAPPNSAARARGCREHAPGRHHQIHPNAKTVDVEVAHRMLRVGHLGPDLVWPCAAQELTRLLRRSSPGCDMQVGQMRAEPVWPASVLTSRPGGPRPAEKLPPHMCATTPSSFVVVRVRTELAFRRWWHSGAWRTIAEHALSARRRPFAPAGWAALAAYRPPALGVRSPVAGRRRDRLLGAPVAAEQLIQQLAPTGRCAPPAARAAHQDLPMPVPHTVPSAPPSATAPSLSDRSLRALPGPDGRSRLHSACRGPLTGLSSGAPAPPWPPRPYPPLPSACRVRGVAAAATAVADPLAAAQALVSRPARPPQPCVAPLSLPRRFSARPPLAAELLCTRLTHTRRHCWSPARFLPSPFPKPHPPERRSRPLHTPHTLHPHRTTSCQAASHPQPQRRCRWDDSTIKITNTGAAAPQPDPHAHPPAAPLVHAPLRRAWSWPGGDGPRSARSCPALSSTPATSCARRGRLNVH